MGAGTELIRAVAHRNRSIIDTAAYRSPNWQRAYTPLNVAIRLAFAAVVIITCFYCLLVYIPFTYYAIIQNPFLSWLRLFVSFHRYIYFATLLPLLVVLLRSAHGARTRRVTLEFAAVHIFAGIVLLFSPPLDRLPHDIGTLVLALVIPFSLCWIGLIDHLAFAEWGGWSRLPERRQLQLFSVIRPTLVVSLAFAATSCSRYVAATHEGLSNAIPAIMVVVAEQLLFGVFVFAILALVRELLRVMHVSAVVEFMVSSGLLGFSCAVILRKLVFASLSLNSGIATLFAVVFTLQVAVFLTGLSVLVYRSASPGAVDAFTLPLLILAPRLKRRTFIWIFWIAIAGAAYVTPAILARGDWDMLFQRLCAIFLWFVALALSLGFAHHQKNETRSPFRLFTLVTIFVLSFLALREASTPQFLSRYVSCTQGDCLSDTVEQYAGFNASFRAVRDVFAPALEDGEHVDFYRFLLRYTNITAPVRPVDINIAGKLKKVPGPKPNIFIFVIDSLRPDYLSPYNPAVDFTPALAQFARESDVMQNAFTRYGGTALAEPAIWAGTMQIHKQYVQPYYPMNALYKLLEFEHYDSYVTLDPIMHAIIGDSAPITELDHQVVFQNYDLCATLKEIEERIDTRKDTSKPVFVYTQPLNVHVTGLYYSKFNRRPGRSYPGFDTVHAAELERLDTAFGEFIQFLKSRGLYDNSIVVVTADHGDSIGEYGRFGHTGSPFPEIAKIPLIIHVPPRLRESLVDAPKTVAFNIDITPTLYYLLGHRDLVVSEIFGKPLYAETPNELSKWDQPNYLIASSYSAAYGILGHDGSTLFIADAPRGTNYFFDLSRDPSGLHNRVTNAIRDQGERLIRAHVQELNQFYGLDR